MAEENQTEASNPETNSQAPAQQFAVQRIYLKDLSFEAPLGVEAFKQQWQPAVHQDLNTRSSKVDNGLFEVVLTLTITVKLGEATAFLVEIQQAGLFTVAGIQGPQLAHALNSLCPQILFPYAREAVDSVVIKGSFPALMLPPINFDALFAQAMAQAQAKAAEAQPEATLN
jgi:preprotein translocase subunit SecB